jgi:hypothetical protein
MSDDPIAASGPDARPWHGTDNPLEAMYRWVTSEIVRLEARLVPPAPAPAAPPAPAPDAEHPA